MLLQSGHGHWSQLRPVHASRIMLGIVASWHAKDESRRLALVTDLHLDVRPIDTPAPDQLANRFGFVDSKRMREDRLDACFRVVVVRDAASLPQEAE